MNPILLIVFLPLAAAFVAGFSNKAFGATLPKILTTVALFTSAVLSWTIFLPFVAGTASPRALLLLGSP